MTKHILVVEDEEEMRHALSEALNSYGYTVTAASDGKEGVELFNSNLFSMVISDIKMPHMNGIDLLREIRKKDATIPVILITAYGSVEDAVGTIKEGAYDYLVKPFSLSTLEKIVESGIEQSDEIPPRRQNASPGGGRSAQNTELVFTGEEMKKVLDLADRVAPSTSTVLIQGESGTGKELLARYIHAKSGRSENPFVAVNCAALPRDLLESELFGYERGAFTGAVARKIGKFELANRGTILLDEISEMDSSLQAKLLRVLQEKVVDRVGGTRPTPINVRVIATTNRNIHAMIEEGSFREDLFFRLNVIPLTLPPLCERTGDIPLLVGHFIKKHSKRTGKKISGVSLEAMKIIKESRWRGNARELENVIERGVLLCNGEIITPENLMMETGTDARKGRIETGQTVWEMEKKLIISTLEEVNNNRTKAAELLGISIRTLRNKLHEYKEKNLV